MKIPPIIQSLWFNPGNRHKKVSKTFDAFLWQLNKRFIRRPKKIVLPNKCLFKAYTDCVISSGLIYCDWPEYYELKFIRDHLKSSNVVIDIGAYVGHISLLLADIVSAERIFAFEPTPATFNRLTENWEINGWKTDQLFQVAIGAESGMAFLNSGISATTMNNVSFNPISADSIQVTIHRLDDYLSLWSEKEIGFVKIDVEGFEHDVFKGAERLLHESRPRLIMFESLKGEVDQIIRKILTTHQYAIFQLDSGGKADFTRFSAQNLFAIPQERANEVLQHHGNKNHLNA